MNSTTKQQRFRVFYSVLVNGSEYPEKSLPFAAESEKSAEMQLQKWMRGFPETEYIITHTERISS